MKDEQMNDERFDALMRDAETFRRPDAPPLDAMWGEIDATHFGSASSTRSRMRWWVGIAATLIVGVALGRASMSLGAGRGTSAPSPQTQVATVAPPASATRGDTLAAPYDVETSKYLGQTAALLIGLSSETQPGHAADAQFVGRAGELLTRTRLLLDSPAASDPSMRRLLEDLELVLAQAVRLENGHSRTELDLINRALEQRDVIPRLRTAVADISAN
jgi:hypothetical protein